MKLQKLIKPKEERDKSETTAGHLYMDFSTMDRTSSEARAYVKDGTNRRDLEHHTQVPQRTSYSPVSDPLGSGFLGWFYSF